LSLRTKRPTALACFALSLAACGGGGPETSFDAKLSAAIQMALDVRHMAAEDNVPAKDSPLERAMLTHGHVHANCSDYGQAMVDLVNASALGVKARLAQACMVPNRYDCHTPVELFDESSQRWVLVDPTYALAPHNADGSRATLDDMRRSARTGDWQAITYEFLSPEGDQYAQDGYIDYPLYFDNTFVSGANPAELSQALDDTVVQRFYIPIGTLPPPGYRGVYALQCADGATTASAVIDGVPATLECPTLGVSWLHIQTSDVPSDGSVVLQPVRFVFTRNGIR
jgi:hypothetical protein